ncbi:hypothetical protein [Flavobacterium hungaricum]|uniref:Uncharacterized protein n=1 Tax=Flavobacterium hungaricum TaxID=2082725 RepID=A0ABR9TEN0_9FLAO|nr:hypothetical protein [Flavobacterium hungaricum]MBE8723529.1 hypothetical protein [Flavobacterium hungaricum]
MIKWFDSYISYFVYGFGIITVVLAFIATKLEKDTTNQRRIRIASKLTLLVAFIGAITLLFQWRKDIVSDREHTAEIDSSKSQGETIIKKADTISELQRFLRDSVSTVIKKQNYSIEKLNSSIVIQNNIVIKQRETIDRIMGSGYPICEFLQKDNKKHYLNVTNSDYKSGSSFDTNLIIYDFSKLKASNFRYENGRAFYSLDSLNKYSTRIPSFNLATNVMQALEYEFNNDNLPKFYCIKIITRNISIFQYSILQKYNNQVYHSYKIYKFGKKWELLKTYNTSFIPPDSWEQLFPIGRDIVTEYY